MKNRGFDKSWLEYWVTLGNEKIDQVGSLTYLGSIISKDGGNSEDIKCRIAKAQGVFFSQ